MAELADNTITAVLESIAEVDRMKAARSVELGPLDWVDHDLEAFLRLGSGDFGRRSDRLRCKSHLLVGAFDVQIIDTAPWPTESLLVLTPKISGRVTGFWPRLA